MYNTIFVYILRVPVSMKGSKGHQKSRKQRKQTGFKELADICVLCSAIASPSLLSSSPIRVNPSADRTLRLFKQWFHTTWTDDQLRKTLQPIVDKCPCRSCKPGDIRDRGLYSTLPISHCADSVLYVDYMEMPKFGGYDFALVVTCGLTKFTRVFPCTKHITREETIKILLEESFCVYGAPKEINSDEDVRVRSDTGWYKRVLRSLNVQVSKGLPYLHTSNPLCERQIPVLKENLRIWCKTERTRDYSPSYP